MSAGEGQQEVAPFSISTNLGTEPSGASTCTGTTLRHEYASRLVERGVPLAQVRDLLGHASITTTERYDNQKLENLQLAAARLESGKTFDSSEVRLKPDTTRVSTPRDSQSPSICQVFVKNAPEQGDQDLEMWLGGRDSNPERCVFLNW
jgi:hypothetical protein